MTASRNNPTSFLHIIYQNVRGLKTKLESWRNNTTLLQVDLIAVTETNLDSTIDDQEVLPYGWSMLRRDRGTRGGGVLLAARPGITLRRRSDMETACGEDLWASVTVNDCDYEVCVVYLKPTSTNRDYMTWFCRVENNSANVGNTALLILGDLNLNSASLDVNNYMNYFLTFCNLADYNDIVNDKGSKLDIVLVSECVGAVRVCTACEGLVERADVYHPPLDISMTFDYAVRAEPIEPSNINSTTDWNFNKANFPMLYEMITDLNWGRVLDESCVNKAVAQLYNLLYNCFDLCVPKKIRNNKMSRRYPIWYSKDIISDLKVKGTLHKEWKATRDPNVYKSYSELRACIKHRVTLAYDTYIQNIQQQIKTNPKKFWSHISNLRTKGGFEPNVSYEGQSFSGQAAAGAFADYFSSVFLPHTPQLCAFQAGSVPSNRLIDVTEFSKLDVALAIDKLKPNSSLGPDNVPPYIIKAFKNELLSPLTHILNLALKSGTYPDRWKITRVTPIFKSGERSRAENYRPIAVLNSFAKVFESVLHTRIYKQVGPYLSDAQHGFRKGRSVDTNLLTLVDHVSKKMDEGCQVDVVYLDFRKAFDQVDNDVLLRKLSSIGFSPSLLKLFASYLKDRKQFVRLGCFDSALYSTNSGVSQGSLLGPLLFTIMANDLPDCLEIGQPLLYADDFKVIVDIKTALDCNAMQRNLDAIHRWSVENQLYVNPSKCYVMSFTRSRQPIVALYTVDNEPVSRTQSMKDLGVVFDPELNFHNHVRLLVTEGFRRLGFVSRNCKDFTHIGVIKLLYSALVRSKLETSSCVWNPHESTYTLMLEKVQKRFLRSMYKKVYGYYPFMYPTAYLQGTLGYNSLKTRRLFDQIILIVRILRGRTDCPILLGQACRLFVPDARARFRADRLRLFAAPPARTVARRNSPVCRALDTLNRFTEVELSCDLFADEWYVVERECLKLCEILST